MIWKYLHQEKILERIKFLNLADKSRQEPVIGSCNQIMSNGKRSTDCSWVSLWHLNKSQRKVMDVKPGDIVH